MVVHVDIEAFYLVAFFVVVTLVVFKFVIKSFHFATIKFSPSACLDRRGTLDSCGKCKNDGISRNCVQKLPRSCAGETLPLLVLNDKCHFGGGKVKQQDWKESLTWLMFSPSAAAGCRSCPQLQEIPWAVQKELDVVKTGEVQSVMGRGPGKAPRMNEGKNKTKKGLCLVSVIKLSRGCQPLCSLHLGRAQ